MNYPTALDDGSSLANSRVLNDLIPASDHNDLANAAIALETKIGIGPSVPSAVGQVLTATGVGSTAWQTPSTALPLATFDVPGIIYRTEYNAKEAVYGTKGDLKNLLDGVTTASSTTFTSASATFTSADTGKYIEIPGAGAAGATLATTMTYVSAHTVTLGVAATTAVTGASYWYGTDDYAHLQATVDACLAGSGGTVFVPQGSYLLSHEILIVGNNVTFKGAGMGATLFRLQSQVNRELIVIGNAVTACNNVNCSDFSLDGNSSNQTGSVYGGGTRNLLRYRMDAQNGYGGFVERVRASNGKQNGLSCESMAFGGFVDCVAENNQQNGVWCENGSNWTVLNCQTKNNGLSALSSPGGSGIKFNSFGGFSIIGCNCKGDLGGGIAVTNGGAAQVTGNSIYRAGWMGATTFPATGLYLLGNSITASGNTIYGSYGHGMVVDALYHSSVSNNTFRRNGQYADNTYSDIYFTFAGAANVTNNSFIGNTFYNDTATFYANKTAYNFNADSPSAHHDNIFIGNTTGSPGTAVMNNLAGGNYWGPHQGINHWTSYNYGYLASSGNILDPKNGAFLQGTGYSSSSGMSVANGVYTGQQFTFQFAQDVGNKQLTWDSTVRWSGGKAPVFNGKPGTSDLIYFTWDGTYWNGTATKYESFFSYGYLAASQTITPDNGEVQYGTGYNGTTVVTMTNGRYLGQKFTFVFAQDVGNKVITWPSNVKWPGDAYPVLSTAPYTTDVMTFTWDGTSWNGSISQHGGNQSIYGSITTLVTPTAAGPTVSVNGTVGSTTYAYKIVAINSDGIDGIPSSAGTVSTGNATLSGGNYNALSWNKIQGAYGYKVLQSISGGAYNYLVTLYTNSYQDNGSATGVTYTAATVNSGGNIIVGGNFGLGGTMTTKFSEAVVALTDAATIATNAALGNIFYVTLAGNRTMAAPTSPTAGQRLVYRLTQDATGSRTMTWNTIFRFSTDIASPTLTTTASKTDYVEFLYNAVDTKWDCLRVVRGF